MAWSNFASTAADEVKTPAEQPAPAESAAPAPAETAAPAAKPAKSRGRRLWDDYGYLLVTLAAVFVLFKVLLQLAYVPSGSMETTIPTKCLLVGWRLPYVVSDPVPERGDIVTFWDEELNKVLVKRVVGLPGETLSFKNGYTYVDGEKLDESYLPTQGITTLPDSMADPMMGTSAGMEIEENLALAERRGRHHTLRPGIRRGEREDYRRRLRELGLGLEDRLTTKVGTLSGGQRQALTLLMATLQKPKLLLLDEHTAALDPQTAQRVMDITDRLVRENHLTTLMITHNMRDAIHYGNRLLMLHNGRIVLDISGEEKARLTVPDLLALFSKVSGQEYDNDRALLA